MLNGKSPFESQGKVKKWPTPTSRDYKDGIFCPNVPINDLLGRAVWEGPEAKGRLNPDFVEYLMGWPRGWTSPEPMAEGEMDRWLSAAKEGTLWDDDPAENGQITRLTTKRKHRPDRLKALGNGQVPTQLVLAWKTLSTKD